MIWSGTHPGSGAYSAAEQVRGMFDGGRPKCYQRFSGYQLFEVCVMLVRYEHPWFKTLVLPRSYIYDRSAPRARDSRHTVVCTRLQAQIVGLGLLHPPIGGRPLAVKSSSSTWPPTASSRCHPATRTRCEPGGPREAVICAAGTSWGTLRRLPSSVCV